MLKHLFFYSFIFAQFSVLSAITEEQIAKRVHAHIVIGDYLSACQEACAALQQFPRSKLVWQSYLKGLAKTGNEKVLMSQWRCFVDIFPEARDDRDILESLAWSVIVKGSTASSPLIRVTSMLGAFLSQDAKGIPILLLGLRDENALMRAAAVQLCSHLYDTALQEEILSMFKTEPVWGVRLEVVKAMATLCPVDARQGLESIVEQDQTHFDEKTAAIEALVIMSDGIEQQRLQKLVTSNRVGLRLLGCEIIAHFNQLQDVDWLYPLLNDYHANVRAKVFQTLGILRVDTIAGHRVVDLAMQGSNDPDPLVATTATWVLTLLDPSRGCEVFNRLLKHKVREVRHLAAAALSATGRYGQLFLQNVFRTEVDPYIKMNLAIGLIGQRTDVRAACDCLFLGLSEQKERWEWRTEGQFRVLAPSKVKHDELNPNKPEAVNQLTRLDVLEVLAIAQYPHAQRAIKKFLQESEWGVSGLASALLLTEGDESAVDLVKALLKDPEAKVRVQAALILALWGKGEDAVTILQNAYSSADRELKAKILEGIGRIGASSSLSFLVDKLQEPYQSLRIIAAAALLECLYH